MSTSSARLPLKIGKLTWRRARIVQDGGEGWLARHSTTENMGRTHHFDMRVWANGSGTVVWWYGGALGQDRQRASGAVGEGH